MHWDSIAVFTINFFAIIPLAAVLSFATEQLSVKLGEALGGLLNATFGNAVELIVCWPYPISRCKPAAAHGLHATGQHYRVTGSPDRGCQIIHDWLHSVQLITRDGNVFLFWWYRQHEG